MATKVTKVERRGDELRITGAVDGVEVTATGWFSAIESKSRPQKIAYAKARLAESAPPVYEDLGLAE